MCKHTDIDALPPCLLCRLLAGGKRPVLEGSEFQNPSILGEYRDVDFGTAFGAANTPSNGLHKHATLESLKRSSVLKSVSRCAVGGDGL
jgi:hypothetical protein